MKQKKIEKKLKIMDSHELTEEEKTKLLLKLRKKCKHNLKKLEIKERIADWFTEDYIEGAERFAGIFLPLSFVPLIVTAILSATGLPGWITAVGGIITVLQLFTTITIGYTGYDGSNFLDLIYDKIVKLSNENEKTLIKIDEKLEELGYKIEKGKVVKLTNKIQQQENLEGVTV